MKEFFDAIQTNNLDKINRLITNAKDVAMFVNQVKHNGCGRTPLMIAAANSHAEVARAWCRCESSKE